MRLFKRRPKTKTSVEEAKAALQGSHDRGREVDDLVTELRTRRAQNRFAPSLEAALGLNARRQ